MTASPSVSGRPQAAIPPHASLLTPAELTLLRATVTPSLRSLGGGVNMGAPYILWLPADELFCLHAYGSPQCKSESAALLGEFLRRERGEPGFTRRALDPALDPETALLPDAALQARQSAAAAAEARRRLDAAEADDASWRARRVTLIDPSALSLNDLS